MSRDGVVTLWQRWRGEALLLARRHRADAELAAAFPGLTAAQRLAVARRSAWLQGRLAGERFATRDAVRLCHDLALDGEATLQQLRAAGGLAVPFSAPLGAPALAVRAVGLYGADPDRRAPLLPIDGGDGASVPFLGRAVRCGTDWLTPPAAWIFPVFGYLEPHGKARVAFEAPLPVDGDTEAATRAALAAIELAVRRRPEAWPWGAPPTTPSPGRR